MDIDAPREQLPADGLLAQALLAGPRGRRLLSELVDELSAGTADNAGGGRGRWADPAWEYEDTGLLPERVLQQLAQRLQVAVAALDLDAVTARRRPHELLSALVESVASARYWQHPDATDVALADARVAEQLRPLALAVARSRAAAWWSQPVDLHTQQHLQWVFDPDPTSDAGRDLEPLVSTRGAAAALAHWQAEAGVEESRCRRMRVRGGGGGRQLQRHLVVQPTAD